MYTICEIAGKQVKMVPGMPVLVNLLNLPENTKELKVKALARSVDGKFELGSPYLKDDVVLEILGQEKGEKIRVAKFHAKANFRRVTGYRSKLTRVVLQKTGTK